MNPIFVLISVFVFESRVDGQQISAKAVQAFANFKEINGKQYSNKAEEAFRAKVFADNLKYIEENAETGTFTLGVNEYSDLMHEEFVTKMTGKGSPSSQETDPGHIYVSQTPPGAIPKSIDYRKNGFVTAVKNQGNCGSCGFFSTVGALEGVWAKATGDLIDMSEQHPGDCSHDYHYPNSDHYGVCDGSGPAINVYKYLRDNGGIMSEEDYPYTAENGECKYNQSVDQPKVVAAITGWKDVPNLSNGSVNITALKSAISSEGTIDAAINAYPREFNYYKSGIYRPNTKSCDGFTIAHGVVVVGYGSEKGQDYWILKNSWGTTWGEKGFMKIATTVSNDNGKCNYYEMGIYRPSFPTVR